MSPPTSRAGGGRERSRVARGVRPSRPEQIGRDARPPRPCERLHADRERTRGGAARLVLALVAALVALSLPGEALERAVSLAGSVVEVEGSLGWVGGPGVGVARAASPSPSPPAGDPRSPGQGPGFVGEPLLAVGLVLAVGFVAALVTLAYVRLTPTEEERTRRRSGR